MTMIDQIRLAQIGSCTCGTKTPDVGFHATGCRYRILDQLVFDLFSITVKARMIASDKDSGSTAMERANDILRTVEKTRGASEGTVVDPRPGECRYRLRDEGRAYPRSGCKSCGISLVQGGSCPHGGDDA